MIEIETLMLLFFVIAFVISIWKIYVFLPKKRLIDDDTTEASVKELTELMLQCITEICDSGSPLTHERLYESMRGHERFDEEHYWRFNQNRLNHLIRDYYAYDPEVSSLQEIYEAEKNRKA